MNQSKTKSLVECAIMIALATVLSMIKLAELPYGGSITIASMLPTDGYQMAQYQKKANTLK